MDIAMSEYYLMSRYPQFPETILNKIEKNFNKTKKGLKSRIRDSKSAFLKILAVRVWNPPARQQCHIGLL